MTPPLRVLWLVKGLGRGGAEMLLAGLARRFPRDEVQPQVAYVLPHKDDLVDELERLGVPTHCLGRHRHDLLWGRRLRRLVAAERIDLVHTHSPVPAVVARSALWRSPVPFVHTEHNVWPRYHPVTRALNARTIRRNAAVIAVSEAVAESISVRMPVHTIIHGVPLEQFTNGEVERRAARAAIGVPEDAPVVGTIGHLTPKKGQGRLLEAVASLGDRSVHTVIVGRGPLEDELRARAASLGIGDRTHFLGMRDDVPALLPGMDVFVLPSLYEGLPIALVEAMAASLPVLATDVGGIPEVVRPGIDGILVGRDDQEALVTALRRLLDDPEERARFGAAARCRAELFDLGAAAASTIAVYEKVARR